MQIIEIKDSRYKIIIDSGPAFQSLLHSQKLRCQNLTNMASTTTLLLRSGILSLRSLKHDYLKNLISQYNAQHDLNNDPLYNNKKLELNKPPGNTIDTALMASPYKKLADYIAAEFYVNQNINISIKDLFHLGILHLSQTNDTDFQTLLTSATYRSANKK